MALLRFSCSLRISGMALTAEKRPNLGVFSCFMLCFMVFRSKIQKRLITLSTISYVNSFVRCHVAGFARLVS